MATIFALIVGSTGLAGSATANGPSWVMPDVKGWILSQAMDEVRAAARPVEIEFSTTDTKGPREQINMTNWSVCWQYPKAGALVPQKENYVSFGVKRLTDNNCWS